MDSPEVKKSMLTIFSVPKKFSDQFDIIQRNAITSWTKISPQSQIILFGNDQGTAEICKELNLKHVPQIERNEYNTPLLNDIFQKAKKAAKYDTLLFIMADIILLTNPAPTIEKVKKKFNKFLLVGQRYEIKVSELIDFEDKRWKERLTENYLLKSKLKGPSWMDYFIFPKSLFNDIPAFAIGRTFWDKWLVWNTLANKYPVIDCTSEILALHQTHDYSHVKGESREVWEGQEAQNNITLAGGWSHGKNISDCLYRYTNDSQFSIRFKNKLVALFENILKKCLDLFNFSGKIIFTARRIKNQV